MGERENNRGERGGHETLTAGEMFAFRKAYEAAQREMARMPRDRGIEASWGGKTRSFLDEVKREISV